MVNSVLGVVGVLAILMLILGVFFPFVWIVVAVLALAPLAVGAAMSLFRHAAPSAAAPQGSATAGPRVPSDSEASYDPVEDPAER